MARATSESDVKDWDGYHGGTAGLVDTVFGVGGQMGLSFVRFILPLASQPMPLSLSRGQR